MRRRTSQRTDPALEFARAIEGRDWPTASTAIAEMLRAQPTDARLYYNKALVHKALGEEADRRRSLRQALRLDPRHANARFELGAALMEAGAVKEAEKAFEAYVRVVPDDWEGQVNLGECRLRLGEPRRALVHLGLAHWLKHNEATISGLARALRDLGRFVESEAFLAALPRSAGAAALRLKVRTQGIKGRVNLKAAYDLPR